MRLLFVVNAAASSVTPRSRVVIRKALAADHDVELAETTHRNHATELCQTAAAEGFDAVVAMGGDGTLNECANGLLGSSTALAILPGGSTNVFARNIGTNDDPIEATGQILEALEAKSLRRIGLGEINNRAFVFHVGIGLDAATVELVEQKGHLKRTMGHPWFAICALRAYFRHYPHRSPRLTVRTEEFYEPAETDGSPANVVKGVPLPAVEGYQTVVFNSSPFTYIGAKPFQLAPDATLDVPLVTMTLTSLKFFPALSALMRSTRNPEAAKRSRIIDYRTNVGDVEISATAGPLPYQLDGEFIGYADSLSLTYRPHCLTVVLPLG